MQFPILFSSDGKMWVDRASGNIGFAAKGDCQGSELDTFFILELKDIPDALGEETVESPNMFSDNKWKPKNLSLVKFEEYTITDPTHLVEKNGRKKTVKGCVSETFKFEDLVKLCQVSASVAFFEISQMPLKTSKDKKAYDKEYRRWVDFCGTTINAGKTAMEANPLHYRPKGN